MLINIRLEVNPWGIEYMLEKPFCGIPYEKNGLCGNYWVDVVVYSDVNIRC